MVRNPRPVALAVVHRDARLTERDKRQMRVTLALRANDEGYALAETFEIDPLRFGESAVLDAFEDLAVRLDASHVFVTGNVDAARIDRIAERVRMTVERFP
jgi:hypothetical protein